MNVYANASDWIARVSSPIAIQLTSETGSSADSDLIDTVIGSCEGLVNGYLQRRVSVPVTVGASPQLFAAARGATLDIASYRIHLRRPPVPGDWKIAFDNAMKWLTDLAEGKVSPPDNVDAGSKAASGYSERLAGRENMA